MLARSESDVQLREASDAGQRAGLAERSRGLRRRRLCAVGGQYYQAQRRHERKDIAERGYAPPRRRHSELLPGPIAVSVERALVAAQDPTGAHEYAAPFRPTSCLPSS